MAEDWGRLAQYVTSARMAAGLTSRDALATATGVTERTLFTLEKGRRVGDNTLTAVELAVGWKPGSAHKILAGGEPDLGEADPLADLPPQLRQKALDFIRAVVEHAAQDPTERGRNGLTG